MTVAGPPPIPRLTLTFPADVLKRINVFKSVWLSAGRPIPDAAAECRQVEPALMVWVKDDSVSPLKVIAFESAPTLAAIIRTIRSTVERIDEDRRRVLLIQGDAVNVGRFGEAILPALATI